MKKIAILLLFLFSAATVYAEGVDYSIEISQKAGRGLKNVLGSPLEIPCGIRDDVADRGGVGVVTGLFKGTGLFARRLLVGVTELGTFMIPMEETLPAVCAKKPKAAIQN